MLSPVHLLGFVTVRAGRRRIAGEDLSREIEDENHVIGIFEEFPVLLLGLAHRLLGPPSLRDVRHDLDDPAERPFFIPYGVAAQNPVLLVRGDVDDLLGRAGLEGLFRRTDAAGPAPVVQRPVTVFSVQLAGLEVEGVTHRLVGPYHLQVRIEKQDELGHGIENDRFLLL